MWQEGANTYTEEVAYVGAVEIITDNSSGSSQTVTKTRLSANVMHVRIEGSTTETFFEYAHRDHIGSIEVVTDGSGNVLDQLAFEVFGSRKMADWTANISQSELDALLDLDSGHTRKARGFTGHEHLDRTGFIHMNGRVYDPVLGRFLSPDPIVYPTLSQSWNLYSYVINTPTSLTDPSGYDPFDDVWVPYVSGSIWDSWTYSEPNVNIPIATVPGPFDNEISQTGEIRGWLDRRNGAPSGHGPEDNSQAVVSLITDAEFREIERQAAAKAERRMRLLGGRQNEPSKRIPFGTIIHERGRYNPGRIFGRYYLGHSSDWVPKAQRTSTDDMTGYPFLIEEAFAVSIVQPSQNPRITMEQIPSILEAIKSDYSQLDIVVPVFVHYRDRTWLIYGDAGPFEVDLGAGTITY